MNLTSDPSPLDQNFVTFEQLQQHYKVFVNRVQQQLSVGGSGEVRLEFLDDIDRSTHSSMVEFLSMMQFLLVSGQVVSVVE